MISYSQKVKQELTEGLGSRQTNLVELTTLLRLASAFRTIGGNPTPTVVLSTESRTVAARTELLIRHCFDIRPLCRIRRRIAVPKYDVVVFPSDGAERIAQGAKCIFDAHGPIRVTVPEQLLQREDDYRAFIRACFLSCGSLVEPNKSYHLEFSFARKENAEQLMKAFARFSLTPSMVERKYNYAVYFKESDMIVTVLNIIGAHMSLFDLENIRLVKEVRNNINRVVNFETANLKRTVSASVEQVNNIIYIQETVGLNALERQLREMAEIRLKYRSASLKELGEYLNPPIGKSGVNHRLKKINEFAENLRKREGGFE